MQLDKYRGVILLVLKRNEGRSASEITDELFKSLEIAQALAGEIDVTPDVSIETQRIPSTLNSAEASKYKAELRATSGIIGSGLQPGPVLVYAAPPVSDADGDEASDDDVDYWESKPGKGDGCNRLQTKLQQVLPKSITLQLSGFERPLELVLGIGSPGVRFVHVNYTIPGDNLGPRYTLMTSQKTFDREAILKDITEQAGAIYSAEKRVIQPKATPAAPPPSPQDLQAMLDRDRRAQQPNDGLSGDEAQRAAQDAAQWSQSRSPRWQ